MNHFEIISAIKSVADGMNEYSSIRAGGNIGTSVGGFAIRDGLMDMAKSIESLANAISAKDFIINNTIHAPITPPNKIPCGTDSGLTSPSSEIRGSPTVTSDSESQLTGDEMRTL